MHNIVLLLHTLDHTVLIFFRQKRQVLQHPLFIADIIFFWIHHLYQVPDAPCNDIGVILYVAVSFS